MKRVLLFANIFVFASICCFILSPLRIGTDSTRLFAMALPAACGGAYGVDQFPPFYPHLLCVLMKLGICNSVVLWSVNFLSLGIGLVILRKILNLNAMPYVESMLVLLSVQLSWCIAKHCMLPQTDVLLLPFFWGSVLALMCFKRTNNLLMKSVYLLLSLALAVVAMTIRIAAIPLFGLIAVAITGVTAKNILQMLRRKSFWLLSSALAGAIVVGVMIAIRYTGFDEEGGYFRMFKNFVGGESSSAFWTVEMTHLQEIMQLTVNMSVAKLPTCVAILGTILMPLLLLLAIWKCFGWLDWYVMIILLGYGLEIFLWPCTDARFLLPIYPFVMMLFVHFLTDCGNKHRSMKVISTLYAAMFFLFGVASWGWIGRQWMLGREFYKVTNALLTQRDYRNAYQKKLKEIPEQERTIPVFILKKFDPRHTLCEEGMLQLEEYKTFRGRGE